MATKNQTVQILLAEDESSIREVLAKRAREAGYDVLEAQNGEQAIKLFKGNDVDIVLLDLVMPIKSGFDVLEEIRVNLKSKVPIIILSNLDQKEDLELTKNLGADEFIVKSNVSMRNLIARVARLCNTKARKEKK
jgi:DNA-binding response OmpR family regulator